MPDLVTAPVLPIQVVPEVIIGHEKITLRLYEELDAEGRGRHTHLRAESEGIAPPVGRHESGEEPYPRREYPRSPFAGEHLAPALAGRTLVPLWAGIFDVAALRQRRDWTDMGLWAFLYAYRSRQYLGPSNLTPLTLTKRQDLLRYADDNGVLFLATLAVPVVDCAFERLRLRINHHPDYPLTGATAVLAGVATDLAHAAPRITITGPDRVAADQTVSFAVETDQGAGQGSELHLEATAGYLPRRRLPPGDRRFTLRALDLPPGSQIRIKVGFRCWPGLAEKIVAVV